MFRVQAVVKSFRVRRNVQTGSWVHPASYSVGTGSSLQAVKRVGFEAEHSNSCSLRFKN